MFWSPKPAGELSFYRTALVQLWSAGWLDCIPPDEQQQQQQQRAAPCFHPPLALCLQCWARHTEPGVKIDTRSNRQSLSRHDLGRETEERHGSFANFVWKCWLDNLPKASACDAVLPVEDIIDFCAMSKCFYGANEEAPGVMFCWHGTASRPLLALEIPQPALPSIVTGLTPPCHLCA